LFDQYFPTTRRFSTLLPAVTHWSYIHGATSAAAAAAAAATTLFSNGSGHSCSSTLVLQPTPDFACDAAVTFYVNLDVMLLHSKQREQQQRPWHCNDCISVNTMHMLVS
jgi:hypothetical protein